MTNQKSVIIILCAARSGSKLFRDVLGQHPQIATIPYDVNYVWKYKNYGIHDELKVADVTRSNSSFIKNFIFKHARNEAGNIILEKTVSNTLRVNFVRKIFPQARFIHLYRDGRDVALSALGCWNASAVSSKNQSKSILYKKISSYPYLKASPYLVKKILERLKYKLGVNAQLPVWGPQFEGIDSCINNHDLLQVCATQWSVCVSKTLEDLQYMKNGIDYIPVSYENFIRQPEQSLNDLTRFLNISGFSPMLNYANSRVDSRYIGQWKHRLSGSELVNISQIVNPVLDKLGIPK